MYLIGFRGFCLFTTIQCEAGSVVDCQARLVAWAGVKLVTEGNNIEATRVTEISNRFLVPVFISKV